MEKFPQELGVHAPAIIYDDVGKFKNFDVRAVIANDKRTGEFHVRATTGYPADALVQALRGIVDNSEIGLIGLDWDIYIKSESVLTTDSIEDLLKEVDEFITSTKG